MVDNVPGHIAIILDGNRRYAEKKGLSRLKGHEDGAKNVGELLKWCKELGVKEVTLYAFSTENFNRSKIEIDYLFGLFRQYFKRFLKDFNEKKNKEYDVKVKVVGDIKLFPDDMQESFLEIVDKTKDNGSLIVNFCLGYGSRLEITEALKKIIEKIKNDELNVDGINEDTIKDNLMLKSEPDLLIRPGGEKRLSNFLLWQLSYSELFFLDKMWPEITKEDLVVVVEEFNSRERRFGS
tara:strand:- start:5637 stop:6347 length:711 start_codon:yes stop_codon:yes gene_type:complete